MKGPTVFGIPRPWSGDEHDPTPWTYWVWFRAYRLVRRSRHLLGLHDWKPSPPGSAAQRCDWCGAARTTW